MPVRTFSLAFLQSAPGSVGVLCSLILRFYKECLLMSEYVNVAFLNARDDLRLFLCDLKDASHLPWAFSTLRWSLFSLEIPFGLPWLLMFPWFSCQAAQGLHWFSPWSFMGFFASLWRHFSTWPVYMPLLSCFPEATITVPEHMPSSPYLCFCLFHFDTTGHCCSSS